MFFQPLLIFSLLLWKCCLAVNFRYGQHFPNGAAAVDYIYGPNGTWKNFNPLRYQWNYYEQYATPQHPFDKSALIQAADGTAFYTARDANGYLLCDSDHDLEINPEYCADGSAFHEHNGIKKDGMRSGNPFTQFWLDDNWLARFMSQTYQKAEPRGLVDQNDFMRWRILTGDTYAWILYNSLHFDTLALDGLFHISIGNHQNAIYNWDQSLRLSQASYNSSTETYDYPGIHENYHLGLWLIFTQNLLESVPLSAQKYEEVLQHSVGLRQQILANQERDESGNLIGWISNIGSDTALINTESVSCNVLALGAATKYALEFGEDWRFDSNSNVLRTKGPQLRLPKGRYSAEILLRVVNYSKKINDSKVIGAFKVLREGIVMRTENIKGIHLKMENRWSKISTEFENGRDQGLFDFVVEYGINVFKDNAKFKVSTVFVK